MSLIQRKNLSRADQESLSNLGPILADMMERPALKELAVSIAALVFPEAPAKPLDQTPKALLDALDTHFKEPDPAKAAGSPIEIS